MFFHLFSCLSLAFRPRHLNQYHYYCESERQWHLPSSFFVWRSNLCSRSSFGLYYGPWQRLGCNTFARIPNIVLWPLSFCRLRVWAILFAWRAQNSHRQIDLWLVDLHIWSRIWLGSASDSLCLWIPLVCLALLLYLGVCSLGGLAARCSWWQAGMLFDSECASPS